MSAKYAIVTNLISAADLIEDFDEGDLLPLHQEVYRFWQRQSAQSRFGLPSRGEFNPVAFRDILPWMLLLDVVSESPEPKCIFRLFGTGLVERAGRDLTGLTFEEAFPTDQQDEYFVRAVKRIVQTKRPIMFHGHSMMVDRGHMRINGLLLPFTTTGKSVDIIMSINLREEMRDWVNQSD